MDFKLSKELEMLRKAVREFATKKIAPNADEWDEFPRNMMAWTWAGWRP